MNIPRELNYVVEKPKRIVLSNLRVLLNNYLFSQIVIIFMNIKLLYKKTEYKNKNVYR